MVITNTIIDCISLHELIERTVQWSGKNPLYVRKLFFEGLYPGKLEKGQLYKLTTGIKDSGRLQEIAGCRSTDRSTRRESALRPEEIAALRPVLDANISKLAGLIRDDELGNFTHSLLVSCNPLYFSEHELSTMHELWKHGEYIQLLKLLFLHAICCAHHNSPAKVRRILYEEASALHPDNPIRVQLLEKASEYGDDTATLELGNIYYCGNATTDIDYAKALAVYKRAPSNGTALWSIGWMYEYGNGMPQSYETALHYYKQAAEKGYPKAFNSIGKFYAHGYAGCVDEKKAEQYLEEAIVRGNVHALINLAALYESRRRRTLEQGGTPSAFEHRKTFELYKIAADYGSDSAQNMLGEAYFYRRNPEWCERNLNKARAYFKMAVNQNNRKACYNMGRLLKESGNLKQAMTYLRDALDRGIHEAACELALIHTEANNAMNNHSADLANLLALSLLNAHIGWMRDAETRAKAIRLRDTLGGSDYAKLPEDDLLR